MFRITPYVISARTILCRRLPSDFQLATISRSPPLFKYKKLQERDPCPPPLPPPLPPPKDGRLFWGAMSVVFLAGGFAVYAKTSPEVRDWLSIRAPWFDDLIAIAYQENMTYGEFAEQCADDLKKYIASYSDDKPKQCSLDGAPVQIVATIPKGPNDEKTVAGEVVKEVTPCETLPPPVVTKDICEIEKCMRDLGETAINNYITARDACIYYNKLVEETMEKFTMVSMKELRDAMIERMDLVKDSMENIAEATSKLGELTRYFECGMQAPKEAMENTKAMLKEYQYKIKTIRMEYQRENDKSLVMDMQWQKVEAFMDKYTEETQTMFPGLKYESKRPAMKGDGDLLLYHTLRYSQQLKAELNEAATGMTERVNRGLDTLPQGAKENKAREAAIQAAVKRKRTDMDKEFKKRYDDQRLANDRMLRESLKKQLQRHEETLQNRLQQKEKELMVKFNKMVAERVAAEKKNFAKLLTEMSLNLKILEDKLNTRLKAERETRRSQELWSAGASLLAATNKGGPYVNVDKELKAIEKASGGGDKLVVTVLKSIPSSVREKGVVPESVIRQKYHVMEKTALKVALVEQDGAPLLVYFLSWLQSVLLFMKISGIPQEEFDKPPQNPPKDLDTFDLLQRARYWIDRGNIAAALRYVGSLEGASRAAAAKWHEDARSHLETRQAAEAVLAHAAALGLQYI